MIIVYPDCISSFVLTNNGFCKSFVDGNIVFPTFCFPLLELWIVRDLIVKCWPKDLFAISIVMAFKICICHKDRDRSFMKIEMTSYLGFLVRAQRIGRLSLADDSNGRNTMPRVPIHL